MINSNFKNFTFILKKNIKQKKIIIIIISL
jgi:hypothetical protein